MTPWKKKNLTKTLENSFGKAPDKEYFPGDMDHIRSFYDACRDSEPDQFHVDETTWNDLDMDEVYKGINACRCTAGEQYLYYMLRTPLRQEDAYKEQQGLIRMLETSTDTRIKLQLILSRISSSRDVDLTTVFHPKDNSLRWLIVYSLMSLLLVTSILAVIFLGTSYLYLPLIMLVINTWMHTVRWGKCEHAINRVNYCVSLIVALNRMKKQRFSELEPYLTGAFEHLAPLKPILRSGPVFSMINADLVQAAVTVNFLTDLIAFEILKRRLAKYHDYFLEIHKAVGWIDATAAIASWRRGMGVWCEPEIDYAADRPLLQMKGMVHPLLKDPVPNDLMLEKSMLITGSNASGKSTYLRSAMICALMAQTLCTCTCKRYTGSLFRVYTSLAMSDDLQAGESYYIAEIKSLKRIMDSRKQDGFILCAIDEVLRGTNTIERIAASAEILKALNQPGILCLVATHDIELSSLTGGSYQLAHFEETVTDREIYFDYTLKPGPAETRNAILLLKLMGFDDTLVSAAYSRAEEYFRTGKWTSGEKEGTAE